LTDYVSWDSQGKVSFTPSHLLTRRQRAAIAGISNNANGTVAFRLASKQQAVMDIALLAGMLGIGMKEKHEEDPEVVKRREHARSVMHDLLNRMAVPEPLIDVSSEPQ
jgi:hypothetical protein